MAPMEALVPATIADIWFVHERGFQSAVFNLGVLGGINLASPIGECTVPLSTHYYFTNEYPNSRFDHTVQLLSHMSVGNGRSFRRASHHDRPIHARVRLPQSRCYQH